MIPIDLMKKYKYGYVHSCEILEEPFVKDLEKENQELKEKIKTYEDPDDLTLMFMYCDEKAKDKIKELKKQLEEYRTDIIDGKPYIKLDFVLNQQKEFIKWLEDEIKIRENDREQPIDMLLEQKFTFKVILSKYKEIIGVSK